MMLKDTRGQEEDEEDMPAGSEEEILDVSPVEVERYLKGVDYPASKQGLIECAEQNGAPERVIRLLDQLQEREYNSPVEVSEEVERIE
jgi:hypothetical protein